MTDLERKLAEAVELVALLRAMGDRRTKHDYQIGHYWNAVDDAADVIAELLEIVRAAKGKT